MKAVLVIDMPNECDECPLQDGEKCYARQDWISTISNWKCPLKPLPQKKVLDEELFMTGNFRLVNARFTGWNDCIDEILGEEE